MGSLSDLENGEINKKEQEFIVKKNAQNLSNSMMRKKSDPELVSKIRFKKLREILGNLQEVILGTKLCLLFPVIPLAMLAQYYHFARVSICFSPDLICYIQLSFRL